MHLVIIGAGEVGTTIAENLSPDNEVTIIDIDPDRAENLKYKLDVLTLDGDGTYLSIQEAANIESADMVIACTDSDTTNLVGCGTAKTLGDPFTIARTKELEYLRTWEQDSSAFGVDFMVCTDLLTAEDIVRVIGLPAAIDVDQFAKGAVQMVEFELKDGSPVTGQTIQEADRFESLTFMGIFRNGSMIFPRGDTVIQPGDRIVVVGSPESVQLFASDVAPEATPNKADEIVIVGGSEVGYQTARLLEKRGLSPRLIEENSKRARWLAENLPDTSVMEHDATDTEFLAREHVDQADIVVAALDSDEKNLLISLLSQRLGCARVISIVDSGEYVPLFEQIGIDVAINPRRVTAEEITRFMFDKIAENIAVLDNDLAEVVEVELGIDSDLVGQRIDELGEKIKSKFVIGAITRNGSLITPRGDTKFRHNDHVVALVETPFVGEFISMT